jgi:hypothetical protein
MAVATEKEVRNYDSSGKLLRTIKGTTVPGVAFEMPMGVAYSAAAKALIITDLENRIVRMPLPYRRDRAACGRGTRGDSRHHGSYEASGARRRSAVIGSSRKSLLFSRDEKKRISKFSTSPVPGLSRAMTPVPDLVRFLLFVRRLRIDVEDVPLAIVGEGQLRCHSTLTPWLRRRVR